jgi:16S rRNA C1402 (ribose-2'-O) methylase RsmI
LKNAFSEIKNENKKNFEEAINELKEMKIIIYFDKEKIAKKIEILGKNFDNEEIKIYLNLENLKEEMVRNKEKENFENFLISNLIF